MTPETDALHTMLDGRERYIRELEAENAYLRERHAEAVAQLPATIEVLEAFDCLDLDDRVIEWYETQAKPHLEHLKALAKEAEV